ncbi:hypothetical protein PTKIN_Ptkin04bG0036500 [Pterospermum kingtungense]
MMNDIMESVESQEEIARETIKHALKALKKRHLVEEGAHAPAYIALSRPIISQGSEWKEKAEKLEVELQQCYKAQSRLSEQLVVEVAESRALKGSLQEKETAIAEMEKELNETRDECSRLEVDLGEKITALKLMMSEHQELKSQLEQLTIKAKNAEAENKMLVDRWMLQKMQDAERLNERLKASGLEKLAREQVEGIVRRSEEGAEFFAESTVPSVCWHRINAHEGGCASILKVAELERELNETRDECSRLKMDLEEKITALELMMSEHQELKSQLEQLTIKAKNAEAENKMLVDRWMLQKMQDAERLNERLKASGLEKLAREQVEGIVRRSEEGAEFFAESTVPSVCWHRINAHEASSSNNLFVWDVNSGRVRHTLTGHTDKVCAVDVSKVSSRHVVSAAYDRTIKVWDLQKGYCTNMIIFHSNFQSLCFSTNGLTIYSGHVDGNLRLWDIQTGKLLSEVAAHSLAITSISLSRNGNVVLTSGRDNLHNLFDKRSLEVCGTFRATGNRMASNWSRSCISPDDNYIAAGSADGSIYIWSIIKADIVSTLKEHTAPVLCCTWSGLGKPLASADKNGIVCTWT